MNYFGVVDDRLCFEERDIVQSGLAVTWLDELYRLTVEPRLASFLGYYTLRRRGSLSYLEDGKSFGRIHSSAEWLYELVTCDSSLVSGVVLPLASMAFANDSRSVTFDAFLDGAGCWILRHDARTLKDSVYHRDSKAEVFESMHHMLWRIRDIIPPNSRCESRLDGAAEFPELEILKNLCKATRRTIEDEKAREYASFEAVDSLVSSVSSRKFSLS